MTSSQFEHDNLTPENAPSNLEQFFQDYAQAKSDQAELETAKQVLALALSKLDKKQLKVSLTDQAKLGTEWALQMKQESLSGSILFRAVKA